MAETLSLLEFIRELLFNDSLRQDFAENPEGTLAEHGLENLSPDDVHDALVLVEDNQTADFSREYNTGGNAVATFTPPPPVVHHDGGGDSHHQAVEYLNNYITNNFTTIDDRDTITDNSINQQIDNRGGVFDQDIDVDSVVASGDGAVAAGDDIEDSTIVTGDGNTVGDGNVRGDGNIVGDDNDGNLVGDGDGNVVGDDNQAVTGNDNTTSFGSGDATSVNVGGDFTADDGSSIAIGGNSSVDNSETDNSTNDSFNNETDNSTNDSFNTDTDVDVDIEDSFTNETDNSTNDSFNDDSTNTVDNSTAIG
jgi:hypothetical protein